MDLPITPILCDVIAAHLGQTLSPEVASQIVAQVATRCYPGPADTSMVEPKQVGSYRIYCARAADTLHQLRPIHEQHWQETESHRHDLTFNPNYARAIDLEAQGRYLLIVAQHIETGDLVGNYGIYLASSMHTQKMIATEDTLFVASAHRKGRLGIAMIRYAEAALWAMGAEELNVSVKLVNSVGQMIERMGYLPVGTQYTKILKDPTHVRT